MIASRRTRTKVTFLVAAIATICLLVGNLGFTQEPAKKPLNNQDIIKMIGAGLGEDTIISSIEANETAFDTSPDALVALKNSGVSEKVINAMIAASKRSDERASKPAETTVTPTTVAKPPKEGKATVYFYRYKQFLGSALEPSVFCDDVQLARMDNGRYFVVAIDAGQHTLRSNDKQSGVSLNLQAGETYYLRVELATGFWKGHGRIVLAQPQQGEFEIKKLEYIGADKVKDQRVQAKPQ